ncbi:MAG: hypothetical protein RMJ98_20485, partial [Myxococcales bacterium]|nr:hypothetical protein [Myxococcales bacterium]
GNSGSCTTSFDCPGMDDECKQRTCTAGVCGLAFTPKGKIVAVQEDGDCKQNVCDGEGKIVSVSDESDVPKVIAACAEGSCSNGVPEKKLAAIGTGCDEGGGNVCDGKGTCVATFVVVRVGAGVNTLDGRTAPVFLEERLISDGTLLPLDPVKNPLVLPSSGSGDKLTLTGSGILEGNLSRSLDGKYLVLGGYDVDAGVDKVAGSPTTQVKRVVGRLDRSSKFDASTKLDTAFNNGSIRSACTTDGLQIWASGIGSGNSGGIWATSFGSKMAGDRVLAEASAGIRFCHFFFDRLYGTAKVAPYVSVFQTTDAIPTQVGQQATTLPGLPTDNKPSPLSFVLLDTDANGDPDLLYIADDRTTGTEGGVYKWVWDGSTWKPGSPPRISLGPTTGARGLAGFLRGKEVTLIVTTHPASANTIKKVVDNLELGVPVVTDLHKAPTHTVFRGVALGTR